jgi:NitT/TauT family transport system substrate-binding protein
MRRAAFVATIAAAGASPAAAQTATKLTVGVNGSDDVSPLLWAKTSGMFARAGLDVAIQKFSSGSVAVAALVGGSLDVVRASLPPLISAHSRGLAVQLIAPADLALAGAPTEGIVVAKSSTITTGKELNGATLPVPAVHSFNEIATRAWIDASGGDSRTVRFIEIPISSIVPAIEAGRVPAGMVTDPFLKDALAADRVRVIGRPGGAIGKRYLITAYVAMGPYIAAHRDAVGAFARTLAAADDYTTAHHAEVLAAVAPFWGISAAAISDMPAQPYTSVLDPRDIQPLIDVAARYGVIPERFPAEAMIAPGLMRSN